jgi:hypothetical protein
MFLSIEPKLKKGRFFFVFFGVFPMALALEKTSFVLLVYQFDHSQALPGIELA